MANARKIWTAVLSCAVLLVACSTFGGGEFEIASIGRDGSADPSETPEQGTTAADLQYPESIVIEEPGVGSRLVGSVRLRGMADPTHEQHLGMRLLVPQGEIVAEGNTLIDAPLGERGPFEGELTFSVEEERPALVQVFSTSARDGKLTHMTSIPVTLAPSGETEIETSQPRSETIVILEPAAGDQVAGGTVLVRGLSLRLLQNSLTIEVQNDYGGIVGLKTITLNPGVTRGPAAYETEVGYRVESGGPGRIVVREASSIFGRSVHINSVDIDLQP